MSTKQLLKRHSFLQNNIVASFRSHYFQEVKTTFTALFYSLSPIHCRYVTHFTHLDTVYQSISSYANTSLFHPCSFAYVYQHRFQFHNLIRWHLSRGHSTLCSADDLKRTINNLFTALMGLRHVASIGQLLIKAGRQTSKHINVELTLKQR